MTGVLERLPGGPTCSAGPRPDFPERTSLPVRTASVSRSMSRTTRMS